MNFIDIILLVVIALSVYFAVRKVLRDRKNGKYCGGDCGNCSQSCKRK